MNMVLELSNIVGTAIGDFINYALAIVSVMILYYIIKLFLVGGSSKEEKGRELEAQRQAWGERFESWKEKKKRKEAEEKKKQEKERKRLNVSPIKENLVGAIEAGDEVLALLGKAKTNHDRDKIISLIKGFDKEMDRAGRNLRLLRRELEGEERNYLTERITELEAIQDYINNNCGRKLPLMGPAFWSDAQSLGIPKAVKEVRAMCHHLWNKIDQFHG